MKCLSWCVALIVLACALSCNKSPTGPSDSNSLQQPSTPTPNNGAVDWLTTSKLSWSCKDTDTGIALRFDLYLDTVNPPLRKVDSGLAPLMTDASGLRMGTFAVSNLRPNTAYYWKVTATDGKTTVTGSVWQFTTYNFMIASSMKLIPAGTFKMGDSNKVIGGDELPVHTVSVSAFYMDSTDVTEGDYGSTMNGLTPSSVAGVRYPVEHMTWYDAVLYCNVRSRRDGLDTVYSYTSITGTPGNGCTNLANLTCDFTKKGYRLPTEAEWEYACRGTTGAYTDFYWGRNYPPVTAADSAAMMSHLYFNFYLGAQDPYMVAKRQPNDLGLYDMIGDVAQWCNDLYASDYYSTSPAQDPTGPAVGSDRVVRTIGHEYDPSADKLITAYRTHIDPSSPSSTTGFRCVRRP